MPPFIGYPKKIRKNLKRADMEKIVTIKSMLEDAKRLRQTEREGVWQRAKDLYMGRHWPDVSDDPTADLVVVNKTFSTIATIVPFISGGDLEFIVEAYSGDANSESARYISIFLNRLWRTNEFDGARRLHLAAWDMIVYGDGYLLPSYDIEIVQQFDQNGNPIPTSGREVARFSLEHVSPWHVWIDRFATGLWDANWYIRRIVMPKEQAESDSSLVFIDGIETTSNEESLGYDDSNFQHMVEGGREMVVLYEFYDALTKDRIIFSEFSEFPHQWIVQSERLLVQLPNHPIPSLPYHMGDVEQMLDLQRELNKTRSQMLTYRRRNVVKYLYDESALDDDALTLLQSSITNVGIPVNTSQASLSDVFQVINPTPIYEDTYNVAAIISNDIDEMTGVNEYLRGNLPEGSRTATEASIIEGASNTKVRQKLRIIERGAREVGQILLDMMAAVIPTTSFQELKIYLTGEEAQAALVASGQDVYDEQGRPLDALLQVRPALFTGKYEVFVQTGSSELRNPIAKEQKYRNLFITLLQAYPMLLQAGVTVSLRQVLRLWLEAVGVADINSILDDPAAIAAAQSQLALQAVQAGGQIDTTGQPNPFGVQPPSDLIDFNNSGMLPPNEGAV